MEKGQEIKWRKRQREERVKFSGIPFIKEEKWTERVTGWWKKRKEEIPLSFFFPRMRAVLEREKLEGMELKWIRIGKLNERWLSCSVFRRKEVKGDDLLRPRNEGKEREGKECIRRKEKERKERKRSQIHFLLPCFCSITFSSFPGLFFFPLKFCSSFPFLYILHFSTLYNLMQEGK